MLNLIKESMFSIPAKVLFIEKLNKFPGFKFRWILNKFNDPKNWTSGYVEAKQLGNGRNYLLSF